MPGKPDVALCSMGIYVFETTFLIDLLKRDAADTNSSHDFGKDIIPYIVKNGKAVAHHFSQSCVSSTEEAKHYWRDVGTVDAYWAANIDLTDIVPDLDLYDRAWPIWTYGEITPPAKFVHDIDGRRGLAISSLLSGGCIVSGAAISRSLVFTGVHVHSYSTVHEAVILPYARIGRNVRLSKVVIDSEVIIPDGLVVGEDPELDADAVPAHRGRRDADHRADDRKAQGMSELKVLSVASEIFPLVKTGGLADVAGALPGALKREDVLDANARPGLSGGQMAKLADVSTAREYDDLFGGPARVLAGAAAGLDLFAIDAPHLYDRPGNPYLGPRRARLAGQCAPLRGARAGRRRHRTWRDPARSSPRSFTLTTGRPRSRPPICIFPQAAARFGRDDPQPRLSGSLSAFRSSGSSDCPTER